MIFFLALTSDGDRREFLSWAEEHLNKQSDDFQQRFRAAMIGVELAIAGGSIDAHSATGTR